MNSRDRSLKDGPSIVTTMFPCISLVIRDHFYWFGWIYGYVGLGSVGLGSVGLGSVGGLRGSLKKVCLMDYFVISKPSIVS